MKNILILGCGGTAAVNFVKCLRMAPYANFHIVGTDLSEYHLRASNVDAKYLIAQDEEDLTVTIERIALEEKIDFVYAAPDLMVQRLSLRRHQITPMIFLPDHRTISICHDKWQTNQVLTKASVAVPLSVNVTASHDAILYAAFQKIKNVSEVVWLRKNRGAGSAGALPVKTIDQVRNWIQYWVEMKGAHFTDFMLCEHLPGREFAHQSLWYEGKLVSSFSRERLEYVFAHIMPSGQSSTPSVARVSKDLRVPLIGADAVKAVDPMPHGVYGVDMKEDEWGELKVTEINIGRFYTTSDFGAAMEVNLPYDYMLLGTGTKVSDLVYTKELTGEDIPTYWIRGLDKEPTLWKQKNDS